MIELHLAVEGHGEVAAAPTLLRRIASRLAPDSAPPHIPRPWRVHAGRIFRGDWSEMKSVFDRARITMRGPGNSCRVLLVLDTDCERCPASEVAAMKRAARTIASDIRFGIVLAHCEFETWFIAAAGSLRGRCGLPGNMSHPANAETIHGAKAWLSRYMPPNRPYKETLDQKALADAIDLDIARANSPSFDKLWREVATLMMP